MLLRGGANLAVATIQQSASGEQEGVVASGLQQAASTLQATPGLQQASSIFQQVTGVRTQVPQGVQETICNGNICFISTCGQFELLSAIGDSLTQEVTITLLITQRLQSAPVRHTLGGIICIDAQGNSYEMIEPAPESEWRNLPYNVPVRVVFRRIGPVSPEVDKFIYVQAASWDNTFEGACSPAFRNVPIVWE
jgi:hypothetical protein